MDAATNTSTLTPSINVEFIFYQIYKLITGSGFDFAVSETFWSNFKIFSTILSLLLLTGIVYLMIRISQLRAEERARLHKEDTAPDKTQVRKNEKWERVMEHIESENQNDWRLAVMEADIMLDDLLTERGYQGESLGEKLKQINKNQMRTLDAAWEAHKIRNQIAHKGGDYILTQRDARRAIDNYRQVFEEANYI